MEEIIKHIHMDMLQAHCDPQSYMDDYMFLTERLENVFQKNKNVKLEVFLMLYCREGEITMELSNTYRHLQANDLLISLPQYSYQTTFGQPRLQSKDILLFQPLFSPHHPDAKIYVEIDLLHTRAPYQAF